MAFNDRLKEARNNVGLTQEQLAKKLGLAKSTITGYEKGTSEPNMITVKHLMDILKVDANYLWQDEMTGSTSLIVSSDEWNHIKKLRALDAYGKKVVNSVLDIEYERCNYETEIADEPMAYIPRVYYSQGASAGYGEYLIDGMDASEIMLPDTPKNRKSDYVINVDGDSMEPTFSDGDKLLVQHTDCVNVGEIGIFIIDGQSYVKEFGEDRLISHNKKYPDIIPSEYSDFRCVGKVIGVMK
ncbi:XRE family transcriptional regulator [Holdemania massiliensis]|uniref:XRE family transcriptional regulator n=1 Tax=Holdemania massiliensis TaxID=1468449 RepID=UPI0035698452